VALVTRNVLLELTAWLTHTIIDEAKVRDKATFAQDQALHVGCRARLGYLVVSVALLSGQSISVWWR
jgi:hypothetical protein